MNQKDIAVLRKMVYGDDAIGENETEQTEHLTLAVQLTGAEIDTLHALFKRGPLDDGDVPSKSGRDGLVSKGLGVRIIHGGEWGGNACTYLGGHVYNLHTYLTVNGLIS